MPYKRIAISEGEFIRGYNNNSLNIQTIISEITYQLCSDLCHRSTIDKLVMIDSFSRPISSPRTVFFSTFTSINTITQRPMPIWWICKFDYASRSDLRSGAVSFYKLRINLANRIELKKSIPIVFAVLFSHPIAGGFKYLVHNSIWDIEPNIMYNKITIYLRSETEHATGLPEPAALLSLLFQLDTALVQNHVIPGDCDPNDFTMREHFKHISARYAADEAGQYIRRSNLVHDRRTAQKNEEICRKFFAEMMAFAG